MLALSLLFGEGPEGPQHTALPEGKQARKVGEIPRASVGYILSIPDALGLVVEKGAKTRFQCLEALIRFYAYRH
jgi:hypothetical protein